jgi:hypothetical protein
MEVRMKNVVVLVFCDDHCRVRVVPFGEAPNEIGLRYAVGEWVRDGVTYKVGTNRPLTPEDRRGVIGVYDRSRTEHMDAMMRVMYEATNTPCACRRDNG